MNREARTVIGADLGGTYLKLGAVDAGGRIVARSRVRTDRSGDPAFFTDWLADALRTFASSLPEEPLGIGLGCPGLIDPEEGLCLRITNIPGVDGLPLGGLLADRLGMPVVVENDVNAMAYGEFVFGAGRPFRNVVCLTLGTGVGGGLVLDGRLYRGTGFTAGEIGHVCVDAEGIPCPCGSRGCLEQYVGIEGLVNQARWRIEAGLPTRIPEYVPEGGRITPRIIAQAARDGDGVAAEIFSDAGRKLGVVLAGLMHVLAPDAFVVGGGLTGAGDLILEPARREARLRVFTMLRERLRVLPAALGNDAGTVGVSLLLRERIGSEA